ncbi:transmembrane protein 14C, putative [Pediculus humanus corporis]|uniref:Transmembrane protein 14C, putative n=1 Tax=Pediculus humanus subsp. corporis TaxID=121224 RepID=E0VTM7_PEDHC|nr:transmembrane protein 14C, putative [Pediculus humanus corporis]EEB16702.1 transmembrane protein 14C, putative [Pediculus humanus corporis]
MVADIYGFAYAATVAAGGIMGYVKAQSLPSLAAGLVFGGLLGYGAYQLTKNANSYQLSLGASLFLTVIMGYRFVNSGKIMPAGVVAGLSLINVLRLSYRAAMPIKEG